MIEVPPRPPRKPPQVADAATERLRGQLASVSRSETNAAEFVEKPSRASKQGQAGRSGDRVVPAIPLSKVPDGMIRHSPRCHPRRHSPDNHHKGDAGTAIRQRRKIETTKETRWM